jgi:GMP synthase-like glutamine amidotransferase/DNA-binding CsgD family transcriptional regulator
VRALALEHLRADPVGIFGEVLAERGIGVDRVLLYDCDPLPDWRRYDLIVAMGAGASVWEEDVYPWIVGEKRAIREAVLAGVPYFGVCFGVQLLADAFGGRSFRGPEPELGVNQVFLTAAARHDPVFRGFPADLEVCEWHSNHFSLPRGSVRLARSPRYGNQAIRYGRVAYGIQCHLEPSLQDIRDWLVEFPETAVALEERHGPGSVERLLDDYADFVPFLQETGRQVFGRWLEHALAYGRLAESPRAFSTPRTGRPGAGTPAWRRWPLVGRDAELERIDAALAAARRGESAVLVLRGEPGVGKTSLLEAAADRARGLRVLRTTGEDASEADAPFHGLAELLRPLADSLDGLTMPRAEAVATILGRASKPLARDRFALYAGALDLLAASATEAPLLLLVDDLHLLDEASSEALAFIAGRLGADGIALLVGSESDDGLPGAEEIRLGGLAVPEAHALLEACGGADLAASAADRIVDLTEGNPLGVIELAIDLTSEQRTGAAEIDASLGTTAEWAYLRRVAALAAPVRQALLVAALAGRHLEAAGVAARALGLGENTVAAARAGGLMTDESENGTPVFRHPLARVTVAYSALSADRLAAHAALADALDGDASTWHRARAARRPDESIAAAVEVLAVRARDHGAFAAAARGFERAARLTPQADRRADRLLQAGRAAHAAGHVNAALGHVDAALRAVPPDPIRRDAEHLRGRIVARSGSAEIARDQLVAAAARCERDEADIAAEMLADAVLPALRAGGPAEAVRIARRATRLLDGRAGRAKLSAEMGLGTALIFAGEYEEGAALVDAVAESVDAADPQQRAYVGVGLLIAGRHDAARRVLGQFVGEARAAGALSALPYALVRLAEAQLETCAWVAATAAIHEGRRLARETGQVADYGLATGTLAWLDAVCGRDEDCRAHVAEAVALADRLGAGSRFHRAATALALLELARGQGEPAIDQLEALCRAQGEQGWSDAGATPHLRPELVEAYVLAGREADARATLEEFQRDAMRTQRPSALSAAARYRALLADDGELDGRFAEALTRAACGGPFEQARTELLYGDRQLGAGRAEDATSAYARALETFEQLGAEPWATRAREGIAAAGYAPAPARTRMIDRLSARELEVALACAEGGSPRAIAERLSLGVRTVELQLASATIKLGLNSPAEVGDALRTGTDAATPQPT